MGQIEMATEVAKSHRNVPYIWGGRTPLEGFDCSGFVVDVLQSVGILLLTSDMTAQGLYKKFHHPAVQEPTEGYLVFYGKPDKATHVMYCIDKQFCIGAQGGGQKCTDIRVATALDARVKVLPVKYRDDIVGYVDPFIAI